MRTRAEALDIYARDNKTVNRCLVYIERWDDTKTIKDNARRLKLTFTAAWWVAHRYKLPYKPGPGAGKHGRQGRKKALSLKRRAR